MRFKRHEPKECTRVNATVRVDSPQVSGLATAPLPREQGLMLGGAFGGYNGKTDSSWATLAKDECRPRLLLGTGPMECQRGSQSEGRDRLSPALGGQSAYPGSMDV